MIFCKACDDKLSSVRDKKKEIIEKYEIKTTKEWIDFTKDSIHNLTIVKQLFLKIRLLLIKMLVVLKIWNFCQIKML